MDDILSLDATGQLQALADRRIGAKELLEAVVARDARLSPSINAVVARDFDRAATDARRIDERRVGGQSLGPLAGLPMTVKDTLDVEGLPASAGLANLLGRICTDADPVARVRAAGAIIWGKTNTPVKAADWQTYNALYGTTNNPWDLTRTPGGSSGGSAAALAAGLTALEIGADISGSLRIPAGFCGVYAHKPSYGLVSQRGLVPPPDSGGDIDLAVVGPMARSARDLALLLPLIASTPLGPAEPAVQPKGLRVALWLEAPGFALDGSVRNVIAKFAARLADAGAHVEPAPLPVDTEYMMRTYVTLLMSVLGADLPPGTRRLYEVFRPAAKLAMVLGAGAMSWPHALLGQIARPDAWRAADAARAQIGAAMAAFFTRYDVLLAPIAPVPAFPHDHTPFLARKLRLSSGRRIGYREMMTWNALATVCGLPATAIPAGLDESGMPVGVQLIGPRGGDARLLAVARGIEEQLGGFIPPPAIPPSR